MRTTLKVTPITEVKTALLGVPVLSSELGTGARRRLPRRLRALDRAAGGALASAVASGDFKGQAGQTTLLYPAPPGGSGRGGVRAERIVLIGMGAEDEADAETVRRAAASAANVCRQKKLQDFALLAPAIRKLPAPRRASAIVEGAVLGAYRFDAYLSRAAGKDAEAAAAEAPRRFTLVFEKLEGLPAIRRAIKEARIAAESQNFARDLSNEPGNVLTPATLASRSRAMARKHGLGCKVFKGQELVRRGMRALLAVGGGSDNPPQLIVLEHRGGRGRTARARGETLCLVGKGITFDSGGISIKPAPGMGDMKHDMGGAAAVVGAMRAIALLDLPIHVVGLVAAAENMPSGSAYRPGDIVRAMSGKTIEVTTTAAEGRVVLADALHYALTEFAPKAMIDVATLTGSAMVALGPWATAAVSNDRKLLDAVVEAGERSSENMWPMPLYPAHTREMRSGVADLKNSADRDAGLSTAAAFLQEFVGKTPWVHLDIAGSGFTSKQNPYHRSGSTGVGVRTLLEWVRNEVAHRS